MESFSKVPEGTQIVVVIGTVILLVAFLYCIVYIIREIIS